MGVQIPHAKEQFLGEKNMPELARRHSAVSCAKMAKPVEIPFLGGLGSAEGSMLHGDILAPPGQYD